MELVSIDTILENKVVKHSFSSVADYLMEVLAEKQQSTKENNNVSQQECQE